MPTQKINPVQVHGKPAAAFERKISAAHLIVIASFLISFVSIMAALAINPASSAFSEFSKYGIGEWVKSAFVLGPLAVIAFWPWIIAFFSAFYKNKQFQTTAFSVCVTALAIFLYPGTVRAPADGLGWYIVIFILGAWVIYPVSLLLRYLNFGSARK